MLFHQQQSSSSSQITEYLEHDDEYDEGTDCIVFWNGEKTMQDFDKLYNAAIRALSVPASSSPIERAFSQGGLIARPCRAKITDARL
jgi:hAT family C-terminal dimerisation region